MLSLFPPIACSCSSHQADWLFPFMLLTSGISLTNALSAPTSHNETKRWNDLLSFNVLHIMTQQWISHVKCGTDVIEMDYWYPNYSRTQFSEILVRSSSVCIVWTLSGDLPEMSFKSWLPPNWHRPCFTNISRVLTLQVLGLCYPCRRARLVTPLLM